MAEWDTKRLTQSGVSLCCDCRLPSPFKPMRQAHIDETLIELRKLAADHAILLDSVYKETKQTGTDYE